MEKNGKHIVVPGELVTEERKKLGSHVYLHQGRIYADSLGIARVDGDMASVVPLEGKYQAMAGDLVVGVLVSEKFAGYVTDINHFCSAFVLKKELPENLKSGTIVSAKVVYVNEMNEVELEQPRVFYGGDLITVSPVKIPRIIGKNGSMLEVIKNGTGCSIMVGRNGRIWLKGSNVPLAVKAIEMIEKQAHLDNLTERVTAFLREEGRKMEAARFAKA